MDTNVKVIGNITLPDAPQKHKCVCTECGCKVNDKFGDQRHEVKVFDSRDAIKPSAIRWLCDWCFDEEFSNHEPKSIFD